eukprot:TRINITY_DN4054_c0_g1_i6.p1 TRINITY_DN4054_c0_g1~~TRINITY_DN4054_c0_g1_i6.p1  ORF type:complete len:1058 (-),score=272.77 TRINITY_DN4054_c0_g1_i6:126-3251(-)
MATRPKVPIPPPSGAAAPPPAGVSSPRPPPTRAGSSSMAYRRSVPTPVVTPLTFIPHPDTVADHDPAPPVQLSLSSSASLPMSPSSGRALQKSPSISSIDTAAGQQQAKKTASVPESERILQTKQVVVSCQHLISVIEGPPTPENIQKTQEISSQLVTIVETLLEPLRAENQSSIHNPTDAYILYEQLYREVVFFVDVARTLMKEDYLADADLRKEGRLPLESCKVSIIATIRSIVAESTRTNLITNNPNITPMRPLRKGTQPVPVAHARQPSNAQTLPLPQHQHQDNKPSMAMTKIVSSGTIPAFIPPPPIIDTPSSSSLPLSPRSPPDAPSSEPVTANHPTPEHVPTPSDANPPNTTTPSSVHKRTPSSGSTGSVQPPPAPIFPPGETTKVEDGHTDSLALPSKAPSPSGPKPFQYSIIVDKPKDPELASLAATATALVGVLQPDQFEARVRVLALMVMSSMGGASHDHTTPTKSSQPPSLSGSGSAPSPQRASCWLMTVASNCLSKLFLKPSLSSSNNGVAKPSPTPTPNEVLIGQLSCGLLRARTLLFAYLAHHTGVPSLRTHKDPDGLFYNIVYSPTTGGSFVVDLLANGSGLYPLDSDQAKQYLGLTTDWNDVTALNTGRAPAGPPTNTQQQLQQQQGGHGTPPGGVLGRSISRPLPVAPLSPPPPVGKPGAAAPAAAAAATPQQQQQQQHGANGTTPTPPQKETSSSTMAAASASAAAASGADSGSGSSAGSGGVGGTKPNRLTMSMSKASRSLLIPSEKDQVVLGEKIGKGSFGDVYRCRISGYVCAAKVVNIKGYNESQLENIKNEILFLSEFRHENIVMLLGHDIVPKRELKIYMELMPNSLSNYIQQKKAEGSRFSRRDVIKIATCLAKALNFLHSKRVIHRDIKSNNVLIEVDNNLDKITEVRLCDFGVSKVLSENTSAATFTGTDLWVAPEVFGVQFSGVKSYDERADIWSYGIVLVEMITQKNPYAGLAPGEAMTRVKDGIPPDYASGLPDDDSPYTEIEDLISRCLRKDPQQRLPADQILSFLAQI